MSIRAGKLTTSLAFSLLLFASFNAAPEDIDIFSVDQGSNVNKPNVLFILENSSNWSRQAQQWPGGLTQGESEARAIKTVLNQLPDNAVNVGILEHRTDGSGNQNDGAYMRYHIRPMNAANKTTISAELDEIFNDINGVHEKRSSSNPFGNLFWDAYSYLTGGDVTDAGAGTNADRADEASYDTNYSNFRSPLDASDTCTRTVIIFIGNNGQGNLTTDSAQNINALAALGGNTADIPFADFQVTTTNVTNSIGTSSTCYTSAAACTTAENANCVANGFTNCSCGGAGVACPKSNFEVFGETTGTPFIVSGTDTTSDAANTYTGEATRCSNNSPNVACTTPPGTTVTNTPGPASNQVTVQEVSWLGACTWGNTAVGCGGSKTIWQPRATKRTRTFVRETPTVEDSLGPTTACFNDLASCDTTAFAACSNGTYTSCECRTPGDTTGCGASGSKQFEITATSAQTAATPTGTFSTAPAGLSADEWTRFLSQVGVPVPGTSNPVVKTQVTTYTLDVFNAQQNADYSAYFFNMARAGGGKYYQARNENQIEAALRDILTEVQAVNSAFSSASLPVNATNRAQNENQVFIGLFRPDRLAKPRWFGNLKRYQLINQNGVIKLGDKDQKDAINNQTGFLSECAASFWTTDSGNYWEQAITDNPPAVGTCLTSINAGVDKDSDLPDGPFVEKGAAAEVLRKANNPAASPSGTTGNYALNRTMKTISGGSLADFVDTNGALIAAGLTEGIVDYTRGEDTEDDDLDYNLLTKPDGLSEPRSTIHGDVIHSRPQPVNFGGGTGVVIYYGGNDGPYRAVKAATGEELWSFIAPEHYSKLQRLKQNTQVISYFGQVVPGSAPKGYFFDGSTGLYQTANNGDVWIFPSMRRGGRKVYALDVTTPTSPPIPLWSKGCPNLTNDTGCDTGFADIGQTWSLPSVAFIEGYSTSRPVAIFGGGYDACEDANTAFPGCSGTKGDGVYVVDAEDGTLLRHFDLSALTGFTARGVAGDVALIDIDSDSRVDYAYVADTGGNVYRMDFVDTPGAVNGLAPLDWRVSRVAFTGGAGRKFLFAPALLQAGADKVYVALGTGDREHPLRDNYAFDDKNADGTADGGVLNRFYVFKDDLTDADVATKLDLDNVSATGMGNFTTPEATAAEDCARAGILPTADLKGWFVDLNAQGQGEQTVTAAVIVAGTVAFSTNRPTLPSQTECTTSLGEARGYFLNLINASGAIGVPGSCGGTRSSEFVGGGLPPSPVLATVPIGSEIKTVCIGCAQKDGGTSSAIQAQRVAPSITSRRRPVYWYKSTGTE